MEEIKVHIHQLGRVRDSHLSIKPFMLFSGDSGLGKSYTAALCHYFYRILLSRKIFDRFFIDKGFNYIEMSKLFHGQGSALTIQKRELEEWLANDCIRYIGYLIGNDNFSGSICVELPVTVPDELEIMYKEELIGLVGKEEMFVRLSLLGVEMRVNSQPDFYESPFAVLLKFVLLTIIHGDPMSLNHSPILPPSRGTLMTEEVLPRTGMFIEYKSLIDSLERAKSEPIEIDHSLNDLLQRVLDGNVSFEDKHYTYITEENEEMPLGAAAASIRELAPLQRLCNRVDIGKVALLFEEPEAHLHPTKQRMMADVLGALRNAGTRLIVTTHSSYVISRINELVQFNRLKSLNVLSDDELENIRQELNIEVGVDLNNEDIGAYLFQMRDDGKSELVSQSIVDGVPFTAFLEATKSDLYNRDVLREAFENVTE